MTEERFHQHMGELSLLEMHREELFAELAKEGLTVEKLDAFRDTRKRTIDKIQEILSFAFWMSPYKRARLEKTLAILAGEE